MRNRASWGPWNMLVHILIMENEKYIDLFGYPTVTAGLLWTFPRGSIDMDTIQ